jgi:hypothetical protein
MVYMSIGGEANSWIAEMGNFVGSSSPNYRLFGIQELRRRIVGLICN